MTRAWAAAVLVVGLVVGLVVAAGPATAEAPQWSAVGAQAVSHQDFILNAVDVPAPGDVWAVGYHFETVGGALEFRTLAEHWDGTTFRIVPTPDYETAPAADMLEDVSGTSSNDVWAVGASHRAGQPSRTLVEHWDGTAWSIVTSADPGAHGNILQGVAALSPSDVWAVGARQDDFYQVPMAEHWTGGTWTAYPVPHPAGCTGHSYLTSVTALSARKVWAAGWCGSGGSSPEQGYIVRWNGVRWVLVAGTGDIPLYSELYDIDATSAHNIWAVGYAQPPGSGQVEALAMRWDGSTWSAQPVAAPQTSASLQGLVVRGTGRAWAVGAGQSPQPPFAGPASIRFGRGSGIPVTVPSAFGSLRGIAYDPSGALWAVGTTFGSGPNNVPLIMTRPEP